MYSQLCVFFDREDALTVLGITFLAGKNLVSKTAVFHHEMVFFPVSHGLDVDFCHNGSKSLYVVAVLEHFGIDVSYSREHKHVSVSDMSRLVAPPFTT